MKYLGNPQSGSLANQTASHNRAGQYLRSRRTPVNVIGTGRRAFIRSAFAAASSAWGALTPTQQNAWIAYANEYPITDALGQSITLTGHQAFVGIYVQCYNCSLTLPTVPPLANAVYTPSVLTFVANETTTPAFAPTFTPGPAASVLLVATSQMYGAGVNYNGTWWQQVSAAATVATLNLLAGYTAHWGSLVTGKKLFAKFTPVNQYGVTGIPVIVQTIIT